VRQLAQLLERVLCSCDRGLYSNETKASVSVSQQPSGGVLLRKLALNMACWSAVATCKLGLVTQAFG